MKNSNKIIQSFWYGDSLSQVEQLCINSFIANGHEFHLYTYNLNLEGVPKACILKDANEIIDESKIFLDSRGIIASFSDYFRMKLLYKRGGWWVDTDIICLKPFDFLEDHIFSSEYVNSEIYANIGCIKAIKKSPFLLNYIRAIELFLGEDQEIKWGTFGPRLMNNLLSLYEIKGLLQAPEVFIVPKLISSENNRLMFYRLFNPLDAEIIKKGLEGSYSIHLFNELWRLQGIDKHHPFIERSPLYYLQKIYSRTESVTNDN